MTYSYGLSGLPCASLCSSSVIVVSVVSLLLNVGRDAVPAMTWSVTHPPLSHWHVTHRYLKTLFTTYARTGFTPPISSIRTTPPIAPVAPRLGTTQQRCSMSASTYMQLVGLLVSNSVRFGTMPVADRLLGCMSCALAGLSLLHIWRLRATFTLATFARLLSSATS